MGCLRAMSLCPLGIAVIGLDWLFTGARGCCRCWSHLGCGGAAVGIAEYGTHLLAAASVEMAGYSSIIIRWGYGIMGTWGQQGQLKPTHHTEMEEEYH